MSAHTPGPWRASGSLVVGNDGKTVVARATSSYNLTKPNREPADYHRDAPQWTGGADANARLIATAPELLEACRSLLREFVASRDKFTSVEQGKAFDAARAAIAKVEGR